jgi:hypothetical protein
MLQPVTTIIAMSYAAKVTIALAVVFFVIFPALAQGLIAFAIGQVAGERAENRRFREGLDGDKQAPR